MGKIACSAADMLEECFGTDEKTGATNLLLEHSVLKSILKNLPDVFVDKFKSVPLHLGLMDIYVNLGVLYNPPERYLHGEAFKNAQYWSELGMFNIIRTWKEDEFTHKNVRKKFWHYFNILPGTKLG